MHYLKRRRARERIRDGVHERLCRTVGCGYQPMAKFCSRKAICHACRYRARRVGPSPFQDRVRDGVIERQCRKCRCWAVITEFVKNRVAKHGRLYTCKICHNEYKHARKAAA